MTKVIVSPRDREKLMASVLAELQAQKERLEHVNDRSHSDPVKWIESNFYLASTGELVKLAPHQKCILRLAFKRTREGRLRYRAIIYSAIKKSGKSAIAGMLARWMAETQIRYGEIFTIGNDLVQARDRSFREVRQSLEVTPGYSRRSQSLPGKWSLRNQLTMTSLQTGTQIKAISVDAAGEAGGKQAMTIWTELWGFEHDDALRFWDEMTPVPTVPDSFRLVETYAGYDGESTLLWDLYKKGLEGRQCTAGELARIGATDAPGESYEELLYAFKETNGDPNAKVPIWINDAATLFMYWDSGLNARRMPWQMGKEGEEYYRGEEAILPAATFRRLHYNEWVGAESQFVPIESWDACYDETIPPLLPGDRTPIVLAVDAATTHDCFAIVAISRHPHKRDEVAVRACRRWDPAEEGGYVRYEEPEQMIRQYVKDYNVVQVCYDPYQLESMMQNLRKEGIVWCDPFPQSQDRLRADRALYDHIVHRRLHHNESPHATFTPLREHILNANSKLQKDQDSTLRIVKKTGNRKIDLAVAMSMGCARCLYLLL
jgi:phage terminase large subunit-like protein